MDRYDKMGIMSGRQGAIILKAQIVSSYGIFKCIGKFKDSKR